MDETDADLLEIVCDDGFVLRGHAWGSRRPSRGVVVINPATGVLARYYHPYARFLAEHGFRAVTYDYRGIGRSRPARLRGSGIVWRDWGERDFEAVLAWVRQQWPTAFLSVVGHSIGGFLPGFAASAHCVGRMLTMGAQYAYWPDYRAAHRLRFVLKWHLAMPALTAALGYFPGRRLGWLEDLPAGVVREWSFRGARMERSYPRQDRQALLARFAAFKAPILAVGLSDDPFGTPAAIRRGLSYYTGSAREMVELSPQQFGFDAIGHFGLFHARHRDGFWRATLEWLCHGRSPWAS